MDLSLEPKAVLRVGTRNSKLAQIQTKLAIDYISGFYPKIEFQIVPILTSGDIILDKPLYEIVKK